MTPEEDALLLRAWQGGAARALHEERSSGLEDPEDVPPDYPEWRRLNCPDAPAEPPAAMRRRT